MLAGSRVPAFLIVMTMIFFFPPRAFSQTVLFEDDFETGNADRWQLGEGWQVEDDNGSFVLSGGLASFATTGDTGWQNYHFKADVKLLHGASALHLNYRSNGCDRYFIGFNTERIYLNKTFPCGNHADLGEVSRSNETGLWYTLEISGSDGHIRIYLDDVLQIDYTDPDPIPNGQISFETFDGSDVYVDNVLAFTNEAAPAASWESTGGPLGGLGYDVRIDPGNKNLMYVTDNFAGVAKSDDAGRTWYSTNSGIDIRSGLTGDAVNIFCLTIDPNTPDIVWAGTNGEGGEYGVFKSTDGGASWQKKITGISLGLDPVETGLVFRGFTIQEGNSNIVYAQAEVQTTVDGREFNRVRGRVYKTINGGESWDLIWSGDNLARYLIIDPIDPMTLYLSTGIFDREAYNSDCQNTVTGGIGVLKSLDGGNSWSPINNGLTDLYVGALRMHPTDHAILYAATGNNACSGGYEGDVFSNLFRTTDSGATWTKMLPDDDIMTTVNFSPSNPGVVYAGSASAFFKSSNNGSTWSRLDNANGIWGPDGVRAGVPIDMTVDPDSPDVLFANNYGGGVFRSTDGAQTWEVWSNGYTGAELHDLHVPPGKSKKLYVIGRSGPFVSLDNGSTWSGIANGEANYPEWSSVTAHPVDSQLLLIADEHQGVILRSANGGESYSEVLRHPQTDAGDPNTRQGFKAVAFAESDPNIVYAGLSKDRRTFETSSTVGTVIYKSIDAGLSFSPLASIIDGHNVSELVVDPGNADHVYAATTNGVYISLNGASSWTYCDNLGARHIEALILSAGHIIAGEGFQGSGVWISEDDGLTWSGPYNSGFNSANPYITALAKNPAREDVIFASDLYSGVYRSEDNGVNWAPFPDWQMVGLTFRAVKDIAANDQYLFAATQGGGVFRYNLQASQNYGISSILLLLLGD